MFDLLEGTRVVELSLLINGGAAGMMFADLGADVIKIEPPGGDYIRQICTQIKPGFSPVAMQMHKNKRSLAIDLTEKKGQEVLLELIKTADIFVTNLTADACDAMGIGFEAQKLVKPDIVFVQYTGFGATGPYRSIPTHGRHMNALAGGCPLEMCDDGFVRYVFNREFATGIQKSFEGAAAGAPYCAYAAVSALLRRNRTGEPAMIDVGASDAVFCGAWLGSVFNMNGERITDRQDVPLPEEMIDPYSEMDGASRYQFYETKDRGKFLLFACIESKFFRNFCEAAGVEHMIDPAHAEMPVYYGTTDGEERTALQQIFHTRTLAEWMEIAVEHDLPIGPANQAGDLRVDPQLEARGVFCDVEDPSAGPFTYIGYPAIIDGERNAPKRPYPGIGEHSTEILRDIGLSDESIESLRREAVIA